VLLCHLLVKQLAPGTVLQALLLPWSVLQLVKPAVKVAMVMVRQASGGDPSPAVIAQLDQ